MKRAKRGSRRSAGAIEWTGRAVVDLTRIDDFIAADNPIAAQRWVARLIARAEAAARSPLSGRVVPERASESVREVFLRTYRIVYRVRECDILVLAVFEGRQRFPAGLGEDE